MYTLGSAPLPAGLRSGSPGGRLCQAALCVPGLALSFRLRGAGFNFLAAACVAQPPALLLGVRWPLADVWRACAAPSGVCGGFFWLDPRLASLALVLWYAVVRHAALCRVSPFCVVWSALCCGAPCWAAPWCTVPRRGVLLCAALRRVVLWRVVL